MHLESSADGWLNLCRRNLNPGAWAEFADLDIEYYSQDGTLTKDHAIVRWIETAAQGMEDFGRTLRPGKRLEGWMRDSGFVNLKVRKFPVTHSLLTSGIDSTRSFVIRYQ